jgi:sulfur relay (sulfurtransferase) DsrF/TusC family protein
MKTTTILISQSPLKTLRVAEALRMGVGLTLCGNQVQALFIGDGIYSLLHTQPQEVGMPQYLRHIETLRQLRHRILVERESIIERGNPTITVPAEAVSRSDAARLLLESDCVIRY